MRRIFLLEALERVHPVLIKDISGPSFVIGGLAKIAIASSSTGTLCVRGGDGRWSRDVEDSVADVGVDEGFHSQGSHGFEEVRPIGAGDRLASTAALGRGAEEICSEG